MKVLNNLKFLPFLYVFIDYDFFIILGVFFGIIVYLDKIKIHDSAFILKVTFLMFLLVRFVSGFDSRLNFYWQTLSQKNYSLDGKFIDLQDVFIVFNCNSLEQFEYIILGNDRYVTCPYTVGYGPFFDFVVLENNVVLSTFLLTLAIFSILYILYISVLSKLSPKERYLFTLFSVSPPVNFILERMNFDIVIFVSLIFIYKFVKSNNLRNIFLTLLVFMKFYPLFLIVGNLIYSLIKKNYKHFKSDLTFLSIIIFVLITQNIAANGISTAARPYRPDRTFGLWSESINFNNLFGWKTWVVYVFIIFLIILITIYQKKYFAYSGVLESNFNYSLTILFLSLSLFSNYDYRLAFLVIFSIDVIRSKSKTLFFSYFLFMFSSPSILHSYGNLFQLVENYQFVFMDVSFYFLISSLILEHLYFLKKNSSLRILNFIKNN